MYANLYYNNMTDYKDDDIIKTDEGLIFNPYNPLNNKITLNDVQYILSKYGVPQMVYNMALYERAFIHRSYTKRPHFENTEQNITIVERPEDCMPLSSKSNERLEFLGDGVLECVTKYLLYRRFPKADEGFMTQKKIDIVKNEAIGKIAYEMGLHKWLIISKHAEEKKTRTNLKKLGCLFEAFIGAMFLDFNKISIKDEDKWFQNVFVTGPGFQIAQIFIENVFNKHIDWTALIQNDDNYKNLFQVRIQKEFKVTPIYLILRQDQEEGYSMGVYLYKERVLINEETGECKDICYNSNLKVKEAMPVSMFHSFKEIHEHYEKHGKIFIFIGQGIHKIKRKAEQIACNEALQLLNTF
jgi:dsRNA-specific ribonuclease